MRTLSFAVSFDYRCPFARNVHEHVVTALEDGAPWEVDFVPFSLSQAKVADGDTDVWDEPGKDSGLLALQVGVAVRDQAPDRFLAVHRGLFALRHDHGGDLRSEEALRGVLEAAGVDAGSILEAVADGEVLQTVRKEHEAAVNHHSMWGVPTFVAGDQAVFVRLMNRPSDDAGESRSAVERVVTLLTGWPELNEFKHTSISR
jgi:hypothetical protein